MTLTYPCILKVLEVRFKSSNYALTPTFWHLINMYFTIIRCLLIWNVIPSCSYFNSFPAETSFTHFAQLGNFAKRGRDWPAWRDRPPPGHPRFILAHANSSAKTRKAHSYLALDAEPASHVTGATANRSAGIGTGRKNCFADEPSFLDFVINNL